MARKKIRDAIAELGGSGDQPNLDLSQPGDARPFDFQTLADELRHASRSSKRGSAGRVDQKKGNSDRVPDATASYAPSAVQWAAVSSAGQGDAQPSVTELSNAPSEENLPSRQDARAPTELPQQQMAPPGMGLAIVTSLHDDIHLDPQPDPAPIEPEIAEGHAVATSDSAGFNFGADNAFWQQCLDRLNSAIHGALATESRRIAALLLVPVVLGALGSFIISALSPTIYGARSEIVFSLRNMDWNLAERFLGTQLVVVQSRTTLGAIAEQFSIPFDKLKNDLTVEIVRSSTVMRLEYRNANAVDAQQILNSITDRYLSTLREFEQGEGGSHRLLTPALLLDDPIAPQPLRSTAFGALAGLALSVAAVVLRTQMRAKS
ncbi:MAG TPA: hypothetical protein VMM15_38600 [Bradyrhizobium sp.]|nr:hypothetical protein [Bradyrhizobium sp.]